MKDEQIGAVSYPMFRRRVLAVCLRVQFHLAVEQEQADIQENFPQCRNRRDQLFKNKAGGHYRCCRWTMRNNFCTLWIWQHDPFLSLQQIVSSWLLSTAAAAAAVQQLTCMIRKSTIACDAKKGRGGRRRDPLCDYTLNGIILGHMQLHNI